MEASNEQKQYDFSKLSKIFEKAYSNDPLYFMNFFIQTIQKEKKLAEDLNNLFFQKLIEKYPDLKKEMEEIMKKYD
ncbi:hypothetical protein ISS07_02025 [Candidatus Woesearchaeota archaeon]|nr:hypothetical protein [Candidatus Woesearchaeota archaeon]